MKFAKRIAALTLSLALCLTSALAAGVEDKFPAIKEYPGYADVPADAWYVDNAKLCYEVGLITGSAVGFEPARNMQVSEVAAIAARVREAITGEKIIHITPAPGQEIPWYQAYVNYLQEAAKQSTSSYYGLIDWSSLLKQATRQDFLVFMALAIDGYQEEFPAINSITALPDTGTETVVLFFYNAGILTGTDKYGTFARDNTLTRQEAAAMISRIARSELRKSFVPADYTPFTAAGVKPGDVFFTGGVTAERYLDTALAHIATLEASCKTQGIEFNWFNTVGEQTFLNYVKETTLSDLGVDKKTGTALYQSFDLQVFYSRYIDLKGTAA